MGLIIPKGPDWGFCVSNVTAASLSATTIGTALSAGANNSDGTAVTLLTALGQDVEYVVIGVSDFDQTSADSSVLADLLIDPAGGTSWLSLINDLLLGWSQPYTFNFSIARWYHFPIWIPAGTSVGMQAQTAHTSNVTGEILIYAFGANSQPSSWWAGQKCQSIGIDAANSRGTLHTPEVSGAFSTWTNLGSVLAAQCGALQFMVQGQGTATGQTNTSLHEFGVGGQRIGAPVQSVTSSGETGFAFSAGPIFKALPSGAQLQVRASALNAVANDVAAYAVY